MLQKIKQNILPIMTIFMIVISAILVLLILKPSTTSAEDVVMDGWTVNIGSYAFVWKEKTSDGKYNTVSTSYMDRNLPTEMSISDSNGNEYPCFCITPSADNGGRHTLSNLKATEASSNTRTAQIAMYNIKNGARSSGSIWLASQTAIRCALSGGGLPAPSSGSEYKILSVDGTTVHNTFKWSDVIAAYNGSSYVTPTITPSNYINIHSPSKSDMCTTSDGKKFYQIGYIKGTGTKSIKIAHSGTIYYSGSSTLSGVHSSNLKILNTGNFRDGTTVYLYGDASSDNNVSIRAVATISDYTVYTVSGNSGQTFLFAIPKIGTYTGGAGWKKATTTYILTKLDETMSPLSGATFGIYLGSQLIETKVSNSSGIVQFDNLIIGENYVIKEIKAPTGYKTASDITVNNLTDSTSSRIVVQDELDTGNIELDKQFLLSTSGSQTVSVSDSQITFTLRNSSKTFTLDKVNNYKYSLSNIPVGTYTLYENGSASINGVTSFTANNKVIQTVQILSDQTTYLTGTAAVKNYAIPGIFTLTKYESMGGIRTSTTLADAQFSLSCNYGNVTAYGSNGSYVFAGFGTPGTTFVTNSFGQFTLTGLPPATYTVTETAAPFGYETDYSSKTITITSNSTSTLDVDNEVQRGHLTFNKVDAQSNNTYSSAEFVISKIVGSRTLYVTNLTGSNGTYAAPSYVNYSTSIAAASKIKTNSSGSCSITNLPCGTYSITETESGSLYFNKSTQSLNTSVLYNRTATAGTIKNDHIVGKLSLIKKGSLGENVYNAEFILYRDGSPVKLTGSDGTYTYSAENYTQTFTKELAGTFKVNSSTGAVTISGLPIGSETSEYKYTIEEVSVDSAYELDQSIVSVALNSSSPIEILNTRKIGGPLYIEKYNSKNSETLAGAQFIISTKSETSSSFGNKYVVANSNYSFTSLTETKDNATIFTTNEHGAFNIKNLPFGTYILHEVKAPLNYSLPSVTTYEFTINSTNSLDLIGLTIAKEPLINAPIVGSLTFGKRGNVDGEVIADCIFNVQCIESEPLNVTAGSPSYLSFTGTDGSYTLNDSNYKITNSSPADSSYDIKTDAQGQCVLNALPVGTYKIIEKGCSNTDTEYTLVTGNQSGINYQLDLSSQFNMILSDNAVIIDPSDVVTGTSKILTNYRKTGQLTFSKLDSDTSAFNKRLGECQFIIKFNDINKYLVLTGSNGEYSYEGVATKASATKFNVNSSTGKAIFKNIPIGTYTIEEVSPDNDNIYKLQTTATTVEVLDNTATASMSNIPWGGTITFTKKTNHGTLYPNCDEECEFYMQEDTTSGSGRYVVLEKTGEGKYQFKSFVSSLSDATKFTTDSNSTANITDIPVGIYNVIESKTGKNYDISKSEPVTYNVKLLRDQVDIEGLNNLVGLSKEMINYVLSSKTSLSKVMTDSTLSFNGIEQQITPEGFSAEITGKSVTGASIVINFSSNTNGEFIIDTFTIDGISQPENLHESSFELPLGTYKIAETNLNSHKKWENHAKLDSIEKVSESSTSKLWDRATDTIDGDSQYINYTCSSTEEVLFKFTNILDHADLEIKKGTGAVPTSITSSAAFIDTDIVYNVSGFSNELETHAADLTIIDYPEKRKSKDDTDCKLAIRSISIPGYSKIENGTDAISYTIKIFGYNDEILYEEINQPLPENNYNINSLSPNVDNEEVDYGMHNIDRIEITYHNFPARSSLIESAAIAYTFRLGGDLLDYKTDIKDSAGRVKFITYNEVAFHHSFFSDVPTSEASQDIKKVNIHKLTIDKSINTTINGVNYSNGVYTFNPDYTSFTFEISGYLLNEDNEWEIYQTAAALNSDGNYEFALPYGIYRLQELHTDGYVDQKAYDIVCDSDGIFIGVQDDTNEYEDLSAIEVIGSPKLLDHTKYTATIGEDGIRSSITPHPASIQEINPTSKKGFIFRCHYAIENTLALGDFKLTKNAITLDGKEELIKSGYKATVQGTSYAGVSFEINLISDSNGIFVPNNMVVNGYDVSTGTFKLPEGKYTISEYDIPELVVPDNIKMNDTIIWDRTMITDPSTTSMSTSFKLLKDFANEGIITNTTNSKVYDEYENTALTFVKSIIGADGEATTKDFEKVALDELKSYNFRLTLVDQDTGLTYTGLLSSNEDLVFYNLPFGTYSIDENSDILFSNVDFNIIDLPHNVSIEKENGQYLITLQKVPNDGEAYATIEVTNKIKDFRGYYSVTSVKNLISGEKKLSESLLTLSSLTFNQSYVSGTVVEIYNADDTSTPIAFKIVDNKVKYAGSTSEETFTSVEVGDTGYLKIYGLPDGKYIVKQTAAQENLSPVRTNSPIVIDINKGGTDLYMYQKESI